jgi:hypothetical protein
MGRGRGGSLMPIIGLVVLSLVIVTGVFIFGMSMQAAYVETNYTAENLTLMPYEVQSSWWFGVAALMMILAMGFVLWYFWG